MKNILLFPILLLGFMGVLILAACSSTITTTPTLAGSWAPQSAELGGKEFPVSNFDGAILRLTADKYDFAGDKGTYSLLSEGQPSRMDIHGEVGPNAGRTIRAIYEFTGGQLTVCYQLGKGERPGEFKSSLGPQVLLVKYKLVQ
jgi:uncharacterized protein (TIGR03067 family)